MKYLHNVEKWYVNPGIGSDRLQLIPLNIPATKHMVFLVSRPEMVGHTVFSRRGG